MPGQAPPHDASVPADRRARRRSAVDRALDVGIYLALLGLVVYFSLASPEFLTKANLLNIGDAVAVSGILAAGMTIVLICGQLDLSVGALQAVVAVTLVALVERGGMSFPAAAAIAIVAGLAGGALNAVLIVAFHINSIIATLASASVIRGLAFIITAGTMIRYNDAWLLDVTAARPLGIPTSLLAMAIVYLAAFVFLNHMRVGAHVYGTGASPAAADRAGIRVNRVYVLVFLISAACAVLAGLITVGQNASGAASYGAGIELTVLTAVLLGGIGLSGGTGRIERTLVGVLILGVLNNGLVLTDVQSYYQQVVSGIVLVLAVIAEAVRRRRAAR